MIIDLATVKAYLGLSDTTYDTLISQYIPDVDAIIKDYTNQSFNDEIVLNTTLNDATVTVASVRETIIYTSGATLATSFEYATTGYKYSSIKLSDYVKVGDYITGTGIGTGAYVLSIDDGAAQMELSVVSTATGTGVTCYKGFNRAYNRSAVQMIWYFVNSTSIAGINEDIGVTSKSVGPLSTSFSDGAINRKYGVPEVFLSGLPRYYK